MTITLKQCKCTANQLKILERYNKTTWQEVLSLYPFRYEERSFKPFSTWQDKDTVIFEGNVISYPKTIRLKQHRSITKFQIETEDHYIQAVLYNNPWTNNLKVGQHYCFIGRYDGQNQVTISNYNQQAIHEQVGIIPVYPLKENIQQRSIKAIIKRVFNAVQEEICDFIPGKFIEDYRLLHKKTALYYIHFPKSLNEVALAYRTLKYEEFLKFHLAVQLLRNQESETDNESAKQFDKHSIYNQLDELPFECTMDQLSAIEDILKDMQSNKAMYRLVQGDVGCGKTIVAWFAMMACVLAKRQAALMVPTEILARQHLDSFKELAKNTNIKIEVLTSSLSLQRKKAIKEQLKNKEIDICIGTHALIQENVEFYNLGLVVADEQHRFGVDQRRKLKEKGNKVDFLLMSATPIPRTLANTVYGDMDISTIVTMPKNRKKVKTTLIQDNKIDLLIDVIKSHLNQHEQIYVVCAAIEESESLSLRYVDEIASNFKEIFKNSAHIGILHGKMNSDDKHHIMKQFENNEIQIIISTTVVEVGVNVLNATAMIIFDAHRFGLSTLHQLRGRVQRGSKEGHCYLLSDSKDEHALKRLQILVESSDGFEIAMEDLRLRGPGDILGVRQSGLPGFILGNLLEDTKIMETARKDAQYMIEHLDQEEFKHCLDKTQEENKNRINYMD